MVGFQILVGLYRVCASVFLANSLDLFGMPSYKDPSSLLDVYEIGISFGSGF